MHPIKMMLPDIVEAVPLATPVQAEVTVPGSKSITNRALVLAALAAGETTLRGALWSEDTQVMVECLQELGYMVNVTADPEEISNRTITVYGQGGVVPRGGTVEQPLELFVANAGTAARFLTAMVCLGDGVYRLHGTPRMHERPQSALFDALRGIGYRIDSPNGRLPADVHGGGPRGGQCTVSIGESSQFASALVLCARVGGWQVEITGENAEESPYVVMTSQLRSMFFRQGGTFRIEPDASSGSYFWAVSQFCAGQSALRHQVSVAHWPGSGWQVDARFPKYLPLPERLSRSEHLGDSIMTAIVLAPFAEHPVRFTDLGRLRVQECERVKALRTELSRCGARVEERGDTLTVYPSELHGAEVETYNDHRMAMCFAILGLKVPGIKIKNPGCVKKTFPNFFQKLAALPPAGLGATLLEPVGGRRLEMDELFAS
ncbi:MAG: 3-phosphoshikimate 1-carboxyvinyltransferase [Verrucomicrobia subdivision 3 bacterium]|nr:3-phosphoshikimate 1-carboxyvinyltransferase [Limisphaerales bacterium]